MNLIQNIVNGQYLLRNERGAGLRINLETLRVGETISEELEWELETLVGITAEFRRILRNPWCVTGYRAKVAELTNQQMSSMPEAPQPADFWLISDLYMEIAKLAMHQRDGHHYLTKNTSPRQVKLPKKLVLPHTTARELRVIARDYRDGGQVELSDRLCMHDALNSVLAFWDLVLYELLAGDVLFYESVLGLFKLTYLKVPGVELVGIKL